MKTFHSPHPGLAGCPRPIPAKAKIFAAAVDGMKGKPDDVASKLRKLLPKDRVEVCENMILLERKGSQYIDIWRVISFK